MNALRIASILCLAAAPFMLGCNGDRPRSGVRAMALTIGLNSIDPQHYGDENRLNACENDAEDMAAIAEACDFSVDTLLTRDATRDRVLSKLNSAANQLKSGDILMISYSGHGGSVPDVGGDEADEMDETWCLYDGELLDDELYEAWKAFPAGVRILVFSDSCHSGTMLRMLKGDFQRKAAAPELSEFDRRFREVETRLRADRHPTYDKTKVRKPVKPKGRAIRRPPPRPSAPRPTPAAERNMRSLPPTTLTRAYQRNMPMYERLGRKNVRGDATDVKAALILISGCQDDQFSMDGMGNGAFTYVLKEIWNDGDFQGDHPTFHQRIRDQLPASQQPNYQLEGIRIPAFEQQKPFTVPFTVPLPG